MVDERLRMAAELLGPCERFVDVGANHGFLAAHMLKSGLCREAVLTDISPQALERARRTLREEGLEDRTCLVVTDGLMGIDLLPQDGVAVCGMGARTIMHILKSPLPCRAVLQANVELAFLRQSLAKRGLMIANERIAQSGGRLYVLICAQPGKERPYTEREAVLGRFLRDDPLFLPYLAWRRGVAQTALKGAQAGHDEGKLRRAKMEAEALEEAWHENG